MADEAENEKRYEDILRRIAAQKQAALTPKIPLESILDAVNALDQMEDFRRVCQKQARCYGPAVFRGKDWVGALVWSHPADYHGYHTLTLTGIWAVQAETDVEIRVGRRILSYQAAVFEAEAFYKLIRKKFDLYYDDPGLSPAADHALYITLYTPARRLAIRREIEAALRG